MFQSLAQSKRQAADIFDHVNVSLTVSSLGWFGVAAALGQVNQVAYLFAFSIGQQQLRLAGGPEL